MSEENIEVAKKLFPAPIDVAAVFATDEALDAARLQFEPLVDPSFVTVHDPNAAALGIGNPTGHGTAEGLEGFIALWRDYVSAWESWLVTPTDFIDVGDQRVLVLQDYAGRSKTDGVEISLSGGNLLTVRDGRVSRIELFLRRRDALEAAGLTE